MRFCPDTIRGYSVLGLASLLFTVHSPYSKIGLTRLVYSLFMIGPFKYINDLLIIQSIRLTLFATISTCWLSFSSKSTCTPKFLSFMVSPGGICSTIGSVIIIISVVTSKIHHMAFIFIVIYYMLPIFSFLLIFSLIPQYR